MAMMIFSLCPAIACVGQSNTTTGDKDLTKGVGWGVGSWASKRKALDLESDRVLSWELDWRTLLKLLLSVSPLLVQLVKVTSFRVVSSHTHAIVIGRLPANHH